MKAKQIIQVGKMKKRVIIILIAILITILAAIAILEIVDKNKNKGYDELEVNSGSETGAVVDLETGSIIEEVKGNDKVSSSTSSSEDKTSDTVSIGEAGISSETSENTSNDDSSNTSNDDSSNTSGDNTSSTVDPMKDYGPWY